ncbi:hypothetical protein GCM10011392_03250 [Wenxinia marina]|uniref:hypothetical protein n=1 Tax=Wenxinia marina TaxID=390641 RepID=UPI00166A3D9B|nr:hypothetical protein [Wenxinia marina]GGL52235.1 hypothetical protein GCM10011392_03250 [Wenxinia marina]
MLKTILAAAALTLTAGLAHAGLPTAAADAFAAPVTETGYYCEWVTVTDYWGNWITVWQCF